MDLIFPSCVQQNSRRSYTQTFLGFSLGVIKQLGKLIFMYTTHNQWHLQVNCSVTRTLRNYSTTSCMAPNTALLRVWFSATSTSSHGNPLHRPIVLTHPPSPREGSTCGPLCVRRVSPAHAGILRVPQSHPGIRSHPLPSPGARW